MDERTSSLTVLLNAGCVLSALATTALDWKDTRCLDVPHKPLAWLVLENPVDQHTDGRLVDSTMYNPASNIGGGQGEVESSSTGQQQPPKHPRHLSYLEGHPQRRFQV